MSNPYINYYKHQAGTGLAGFQGLRYQRGSGFFGRLVSKAVFPLLRFLGERAITTGADIAKDVIVNKRNLKEAAKERLENEGRELATTGLERVKRFALEGKGRKPIKRKRKQKTLKDLLNNVRPKKKVKRSF
jgi:hypothetical protein